MDINLQKHIQEHLPQYIEDLKTLCRQPSVAAQNYGITDCAQLVVDMLSSIGFTATIMHTEDPRFPIVFADHPGESKRELLFYNHYDVQPAEPLDLWDSPPFEPTERNGRIYARGVSDDKGHLIARIAALKAIKDVRGTLPCRVKFVVEGAEEIGSPGFGSFVHENRDLLTADACIWEGGGVNWAGNPQIYLGLKGILYLELEVRSASRDSHSSWATVVPNPAWRLIWALSSIKGDDENILIDGFYENVIKPTNAELDAVKKLPAEEEELKAELNIANFLCDLDGLEFRKRHMFAPTCTICGIESGYTGDGTKTVLPAVAKAKLDFRLVPNQRPEDILFKLRAHLDQNGFADIKINYWDGVNPSRTSMESSFVDIVSKTAKDVYGKEALITPGLAGSGPMYYISEGLGLPIASSGVAFPDDKIHAPNENVRVEYFLKGILHAAAIIDEFSKDE